VKFIPIALVAALAFAPLADAQTQRTLNAQAAQRHRAADVQLNAQYQVLIRSLSPRSQTLLRQSERNWIAFRDSECAFRASGVQGGSAYPMVYDECMATMIRDRTQQLRDIAHCEEGDLSCPH